MKRKIPMTTAIFFVLMTEFVVPKDISGKWTGTITMANGMVRTLHYTFKTDNNILTGTTQGTGDEFELSGKVYGDSLSFTVIVNNGEPVVNTGKYFAEGDSISLNAEFMGQTMHGLLKRDESK